MWDRWLCIWYGDTAIFFFFFFLLNCEADLMYNGHGVPRHQVRNSMGSARVGPTPFLSQGPTLVTCLIWCSLDCSGMHAAPPRCGYVDSIQVLVRRLGINAVLVEPRSSRLRRKVCKCCLCHQRDSGAFSALVVPWRM